MSMGPYNNMISPSGEDAHNPKIIHPFWGSGGGGEGDTVTWTQLQEDGTKIAEIEINGESQNVYAPAPIPGPEGPAGPAGADGEDGAKGDKGDKGDPGEGVAEGGTAGQVLTKYGDEDFQTYWTTPAYVPDPADQNGKFLKSIGSNYMWDSIPQAIKTTIYPLGPMTAEKFDELKGKFDASNFVNSFLLAKNPGISFNVANGTEHLLNTTFTSSGSQTTETNVPMYYGDVRMGMLEYAGTGSTSDSSADEDIEDIYFISRAYGSAVRFAIRKVTTMSTGFFKEIRVKKFSETTEQMSYVSGGYVTSCSIYDGAEGTPTGGSAIMIYEKG